MPYHPPYDGAVQDEFAWHLVKYLREDVTPRSSVQIEAGAALFECDFVLTVELRGTDEARTVAVEIGGDRGRLEHAKRLRRDAALIASGAVDAVYRLRGSDLLMHMEDCLWLIREWERASGPKLDFFSARGRYQLTALASAEAKAVRLRPEQAVAMVTYGPGDEGDPFIVVRRFDRRYSEAWRCHVPNLAATPAALAH